MQAGLPPGPRYPAAVQGMGFWTRPLAYLQQCRARYGPRFTLKLPGSPPFVMLTDPDEVKQVFTAPPDVLRPGEGARILEPIVGRNSVILLDGDSHMEQRKLMLPAFHGEKMARLTDLMAEVTEQEVAGWPRDTPIELHPRMQSLTLGIILRAVFGLEPGVRFDALRDRLQEMLRYGDRPSSLLPPPPPDSTVAKVFRHVGPFARLLQVQREADELIFELIGERRDEDGEHDDVLAMLLEARHEDGSPMSDQELRDELMTLLVAGHETTASTLAWAFERLIGHPDVLARLTEEIDAGDDDAYVTATIQETLRLRPVLPNAAPRYVVKPIEVGGWSYEPGCCLVPNGYLIHHDPDIYPDPYAFRPERFLDEQPGTYTWIPFGGGRRRCLGSSFAMLEMKLVLRAVLGACELSSAGHDFEVPRRRNITIRPARGAKAVLADRVPVAAAAA
jgi:cytochrome P450